MSDKKTKYIIVGGSAAGMAAAQVILTQDKQNELIVLSDEPDYPYFRPMIPFLINGKKKASDMYLMGTGMYRTADIQIKLNTEVRKVDTNNKFIITDNENHLSYDKILFATGSSPYIPSDIKGTGIKGVFALRKMSDARKMAERLKYTKHAVMLGGGLSNLKTAFALLEKGIKVTLIVYSPEILSQLMESDDAFLIRDALNKAGLKILVHNKAEQILYDNNKGVTGILLKNGMELSCQIVCIGKGVQPNTGFFENSGIKIDKGIVTDKFTACNIKDTYAAGDVAVTYNSVTGEKIISGLWTNAVEMGRCAGFNMTGTKTVYKGFFGILNASQLADMPFVSMGVVHTKDTDYKTHIHKTSKSYRKLVFNAKEDKLIGALFIGNISNAGLYHYIIRESLSVENIKNPVIDHKLHYGYFL